MSSDYRALCEDLIDALESNHQTWRIPVSPLIARARAALAEPVAEGPTFDDLSELCSVHGLDVEDWPLEKFEALWEVARAVLARYSHQPAPPAAGADCPACEGVPKPGNQPCAVCGRSASSAGGEVAELAWWLRSLEDASVWFESGSPEALKLTRAADLLEQRHPAPVPVASYREIADLVIWLEDHSAECLELDRPDWAKFIAKAAKFLHLYLKAIPVPVPVSERLPGPEDCDAEGRCWWWYPPVPEQNYGYWIYEDNAVPERSRLEWPDSWLPAHALPLPAGEVEK